MGQWAELYNNSRWRNRRTQQLRKHPLCKLCLDKSRVVPATVVHHIIRHNGNLELFYYGELQSLCATCHNSTEQSYERLGYRKEIGLDGWPVENVENKNEKGGGI